MLNSSRAHLAEVGESYLEHMRFAALVGALAVGAGLACLLHAIVPGACQTTCSSVVASLQRLSGRAESGRTVADNSALILFVVLTGISCVTAIALAICTAGTLVGLVVIPQAFALPLIFLSQNPQLEPLTR